MALEPYANALHLLGTRLQSTAMPGHTAWVEHARSLYERATLPD